MESFQNNLVLLTPYKYKQISAKYLYNSIYKGKGAYGLSYEELDKMEYNDLNIFLPCLWNYRVQEKVLLFL